MFAVTAATGHLGRLAIESLLKKVPATEVVAIVRNPAKAADLGVEVRQADYDHPEALEAALTGIDRALLISSDNFERRVQQHRNVIAAAEKAGVSLLAYTGLIHCDQWTVPFAEDHKVTEQDLASSSLPTVVLRNGWYWENHTQGLRGAIAAGALAGAAGDGRIAWAARRDLAEGGIAVLTGDGHAGKIYELAGDSSYTLADLADEVSRQTGKAIAYRNMPEAAFAGFLEQVVQFPAPLAALLAETEAKGLGNGLTEERSGTLSRLIGRPTTTLADAVASALAN
ncbi:SDR family oxidoreductase [Paracidovorax anthurii]|uniref:NAD(P)H dehydrogenase (Quinone) n=1 Tax=Paracidovorax anthurii TaxID=78229 RepID=A0A328ZGN8_9BURK|nr:SDR family oxidoreductase [Paracidovorax anthurii]RAR85490.1 NAD(P)H dehydrogenase (quinone) [Paracidovorax anthurii]